MTIQAHIPVRMCKDTTFAAIREGLVIAHSFDRDSALEMAIRWRALNARAAEAYYSQQPPPLWGLGDPYVVEMFNERAGIGSHAHGHGVFILDFQPPQLRSIDEAEPDKRVLQQKLHYHQYASTHHDVTEHVNLPWLSRAMRIVHSHSSWAPKAQRRETYDPDNDCATLRDYALMSGPEPPYYNNEVETW